MLSYDGTLLAGAGRATPWTLETTEKWGGGVDGRHRDRGRRRARSRCRSRTRRCSSRSPAPSDTVRWCAEEGITPILPPMQPKLERAADRASTPRCPGKPLGEGIGVLRDVVIAPHRRGGDRDAGARLGRSAAATGSRRSASAAGCNDPDTGERVDDMSARARLRRHRRHRDPPGRDAARADPGRVGVHVELQRPHRPPRHPRHVDPLPHGGAARVSDATSERLMATTLRGAALIAGAYEHPLREIRTAASPRSMPTSRSARSPTRGSRSPTSTRTTATATPRASAACR